MDTLTLTAEHFDFDGYYTGGRDLVFDGHVVIDIGERCARFRGAVRCTGRLTASGSVTAGEGIEATARASRPGEGIQAGRLMEMSDRLFGTPGAEILYDDIATVWETEIDPLREHGDDGPWVVEEWTVRPKLQHLPTVEDVLELIEDWTAENGELSEEADIDFHSDACKAAAAVLLGACAEALHWRMADRKVAEHTLVADGTYFAVKEA